MGIIRQLRNYFTKQNIYPQTVEQAIYDTEGRRLDNKLANGVANPNLLINADFRNPINQRGITVSSASGYFVDRWTNGSVESTMILEVKSGFMRVTKNVSDEVYCILRQYIEFPETYKGRTFTLSAKVRGKGYITGINKLGEAHCDPINFDTETWEIVSQTFTVPNDDELKAVQLSVGRQCVKGDFIDIEWVKLEEGEIATPFRPRLYAEELQLCQRYYWKPRRIIATGFYNYANDLDYVFDLPVIMRVAPTIKTDISKFAHYRNNTNYQVTLIVHVMATSERINVYTAASDGSSAGQSAFGVINEGGLECDAEL